MPDTASGIPDQEFAERRAKAVAAAKADGLNALLVCSRGGGTLDRYANVTYLTNFYTPFPYIPDQPPDWTCRAHAFLLLPVDDRPRLVVDVPYLGDVSLADDEIVQSDDVVATVLWELDRLHASGARVGVIGEDVVPWKTGRVLEERFPEARWTTADAVLTELRIVKSSAEIALLREASEVGSRTLEAMMEAAQPGALHGEIVAAGQAVLCAAGGILYNAFMASGTGGRSPTVVRHNFPTWGSQERLVEGQWFRLGISGVVRGYYFDVSRSKAVGTATEEQKDSFEAAIACVQSSQRAMRPGVSAGDVARAGLEKQAELGFPLEGVFSGMGHGIGLGWDAPWLVRGEATPLRADMVINLERTLTRNGFLGDFEETFLVTEQGNELLTNARVRYW